VENRADLPATPPWRSAAFIAATVATVELIILLILGVWLFGKYFSDEVTKANDPTTVARAAVERQLDAQGQPSESASQTGGEAMLPRRETSVLVLNGNGVSGAALKATHKVRKKGYLVAGAGNAASTDYPRSIVMFRPGFKREADRLAKDVHVRRVGPLDGMRRSELQGAHIALIIGG
jgi:hypothetical protein